MSLYAHTDYKQALKASVQAARETKSALTLKSLAMKAGLQPTYLSRCLNDDKSHLSEDHLYTMARHLKLAPAETDYLLLLRSYATTQDAHRRERLFSQIETERKIPLSKIQKQKWNASELEDETSFLFNPLAVLVHVSLFIDEYRENPRALCSALGISVEQLKEMLRIFHARDYVVLSEDDPFKILELKTRSPHFGREHPLTRMHQAMVKTTLSSRLAVTPEENKESFLATFTMDDERFERVRAMFKTFLSDVQKVAQDDPPKSRKRPREHVYQMSFDLLKWI